MVEWKNIKEHIEEWVRIAGQKQIEALDRELIVNQKSSDIDLVTEMDEWTDEFLRTKIKEYYPSHAMLTEETGEHEGDSDYKWVIDPIDGTANFVHKFPLFCISVAVKYKTETVIGVVYIPKLDEMYTAIRGEGSYLNGRRINVSNIDRLSKAVVATGFPYDKGVDSNNNIDNFNRIITKIGGIRRTGSAAIDLCQVAAGRFEGYWELKINPWDFEAGLILIEEAGGRVFTSKMEKGYFVLVGNIAIYQQLKEILGV